MWKLISDEPGPNAMPPSGQPGSVKCREHGLSLMQELRRATAAEHAAAERELGLLRPEVCLADYRAYLLRMWSVHAAIEDRLDGVAGLRELLPDLDERRRCAALACDLRALGLRDEELSRRKRTDFLSPQPTCAELLGALYVVEGSTLGGRIIARHLDQVLSTAIQHARSYLDAYADLSGMWKRFGAAADSFGRAHPERLPQVLAAARASFRALLS